MYPVQRLQPGFAERYYGNKMNYIIIKKRVYELIAERNDIIQRKQRVQEELSQLNILIIQKEGAMVELQNLIKNYSKKEKN